MFSIIEKGLGAEFRDLQLKVIKADFPRSVKFLVVSQSFEGMPRHRRTKLLTSKIEKILGKKFYEGLYVASGVTKVELDMLSQDLIRS